MKSNPLAGFLVVVVIACAMWTAWIMCVYTFSTSKIKLLETQYAYMEDLRLTAQNLANEAVFYSKQHPTIDPVLQRFGIKEKTPAAPLPGGAAPVQPK